MTFVVPAGSPNGFRATAGVTFGALSFDRYQNFFDALQTSRVSTKAAVDVAGVSASVGLQTRWLMGVVDARYVVGSTSGKLGLVDTMATFAPAVTSTQQTADLSLWDAGLRFGPRIPFNIASFSAGALAGAGVLHVVPSSGQNGEKTAGFLRGGGWAAIEAQPLCDFSLGVQFSFSGVSTGGPDVGATTERAWAIHLGYQPNVLCRRKRGGLYRVDSDGPPPRGGVPAPAAPAVLPPPPPPPSVPAPPAPIPPAGAQ